VFTGIIEELGLVEAVEARGAGARLRVRCERVLEDAAVGSSLAVNGVCLTVAALAPRVFTADVSPETLRRSNLGELAASSRVNLERPLAAAGRFGGHIVQGHVDATGELVSLEPVGDGDWWLTVRFPPELDPYFVEKGSVAVDGISLTIAALEGDTFSATIIPHTYRNTTLHLAAPGARLNLECDILAKYVAKLIGGPVRRSPLTVEKLRQMGY
jgi:riboflavin synthase